MGSSNETVYIHPVYILVFKCSQRNCSSHNRGHCSFPKLKKLMKAKNQILKQIF